jgi:electron transfer flavoprotein beta subunit
MNIVVCVKQVPDTWSERTLRAADSTLDRDAADAIINELDEYAIEEGLQLAEAHGGEVTILSMGPQRASESIRKALSMGADKAIHLVDDALAGSDAIQTSAALAAVLQRSGFDLVILGSESTDARMGVLAAMLSERLGVPQLSFAARSRPTASRSPSTGRPTTATTRWRPACRNRQRGRRSTSRATRPSRDHGGQKKPVETLSLADAGIDPDSVGLAAAGSEVVSFEKAPPRQAGTVVTDDGDGGTKAAGFLAERKFI